MVSVEQMRDYLDWLVKTGKGEFALIGAAINADGVQDDKKTVSIEPHRVVVAYLKENARMGLRKADVSPVFEAWMAPASQWTVRPLVLADE